VTRGDEPAPFDIDAIVVEDDTHLILSAVREAREFRARPRELLSTLGDSSFPKAPGSVLVQTGTDPVRLQAVVHDLDLTPSWRVGWVSAALRNVLAEANHRSLASIALPVLGQAHGDIHTVEFTSILQDALSEARPQRIRRLWLRVPENTSDFELAPLAAWM
jgi:hypothetical protein